MYGTGGRVKDFSNLSSASLCLRCIHKLVNPFYGFSHIMALRNKAAQKWG